MKKLIFLTILLPCFISAFAQVPLNISQDNKANQRTMFLLDSTYTHIVSVDMEVFPQLRTYFSYDDNCFLIGETRQTYDDFYNIYENSTNFQYTNNALGNPIERINQQWINNDWINVVLVENTYNSQQDIVTDDHYTWNDGSAIWEYSLSDSIYNIYNSNNLKVEEYTKREEGNIYVDRTKRTFNYNANDQFEEIVYETWNNGSNQWGPTYRFLYEYPIANETHMTLQIWNSTNGFTNWFHLLTITDPTSGEPLETIQRQWNNSTNDWDINYLAIIYYYTEKEPTSIDPLNGSSTLCNIPNPMHTENAVQCSIENPNGLQLKISTVDGKIVFDQNIQNEEAIYPARQLDNGIYFFQFFENGQLIQTEKVVVQK